MNFLFDSYFKAYKYDLINKFFYKNTKKLPKFKKIVLNFNCKTTELKKLIFTLLALELITNQISTTTTAKKPNIILKIRKGNPIGCKVTLRKKTMFFFLTRIIIEIIPKLKNFQGLRIKKKSNKNMFNYELNNTFIFSELENNYYLFNNLPKLSITIVTNAKKKEEMLYSLKLIRLPFEKRLANITQR